MDGTINPEINELRPEQIKGLEQMLSVSKATFDYYESSIKQIEDKSRNNLTLGIAIVGAGALIAKTDDIVKLIRTTGKITESNGQKVFTVDYSPGILVFVASILLLAACLTLLYLVSLNTKVLRIRFFRMFDPEGLLTFSNAIKTDPANSVYWRSLLGLVNRYADFAKISSKILDEKSALVKEQDDMIVFLIYVVLLFISCTFAIFLVTPVIK
jgi:phosphoglycerate-specific signal transduction histidine kinase